MLLGNSSIVTRLMHQLLAWPAWCEGLLAKLEGRDNGFARSGKGATCTRVSKDAAYLLHFALLRSQSCLRALQVS